MRFFQMFPMLHCGSFPLYSLPLPLAKGGGAELPLGDGYTVGPPPTWDDGRVDRLWQSWSRLHACSVVRDSRILPWKIGRGDYQLTAVERFGELVGLAASHRKGDRQYLISDLLAADADDALRATLAAAVNRGHDEAITAPTDKPINKVGLLVTSVMEPVVRALGFARDAYDFPMVVHILDPSLAKADVAPSQWYLSAND
jgi:hypothetical protein